LKLHPVLDLEKGIEKRGLKLKFSLSSQKERG
jgi:hypothetical protein